MRLLCAVFVNHLTPSMFGSFFSRAKRNHSTFLFIEHSHSSFAFMSSQMIKVHKLLPHSIVYFFSWFMLPLLMRQYLSIAPSTWASTCYICNWIEHFVCLHIFLIWERGKKTFCLEKRIFSWFFFSYFLWCVHTNCITLDVGINLAKERKNVLKHHNLWNGSIGAQLEHDLRIDSK